MRREEDEIFQLGLDSGVFMKKIIKIAMICVLAVVVIIGSVIGSRFIPRHVQREFHGIEFLWLDENEIEYIQDVNIRIDGTIRRVRNPRGGFFYNQFTGVFEIEQYPFTWGNIIDIGVHDDFWRQRLDYLLFAEEYYERTKHRIERRGRNISWAIDEEKPFTLGSPETHSLGSLYQLNNFESFLIHIEQNRFIIAPTDEESMSFWLNFITENELFTYSPN